MRKIGDWIIEDYSFDGYEEDEIECSTPDIDAVQIAQEDLIQ